MAQNNVLILSLLSLEQTNAVGSGLGQLLLPGTILMMAGALGSGKTTLVQSIGQSLGITEAITSPTFALIHEYPEGRIPLYHFDLYRLSSAEVAALHLETYWEGSEVPLGIVAIEWPEHLANWPEHYLHLILTHTEKGRQLRIEPHGQVNWPQIRTKLQSFGI